MDNKKILIHKVKDNAENYYTKKKQLFNIPFKIAVVGASQRSGKTNWIINALGKDNMYKNDFKAENIYIFSPSLNSNKWQRFIEAKGIPEENLFDDLDEEIINVLYDDIKNEYNEAVNDKEKPENKIIVFDDLGFGGTMRQKKFNTVDKIVQNGRHYNLSSAFLIQGYKQLSPDVRANLSGLIIFNLSTRELDSIIYEHNYLENSKQFLKLFRKTTRKPHSYFVINYSNNRDSLYMNENFMPLKIDI